MLGWSIGGGSRRNAAALNFIMQACGTAILAFASGVPALICGCVLFGLGVGNLVSLPPLIIQREFAAGDVGRAVALTVAINQATFAFAPAVLGALRDFAGSYTLAFGIVGADSIGRGGDHRIVPPRRRAAMTRPLAPGDARRHHRRMLLGIIKYLVLTGCAAAWGYAAYPRARARFEQRLSKAARNPFEVEAFGLAPRHDVPARSAEARDRIAPQGLHQAFAGHVGPGALPARHPLF